MKIIKILSFVWTLLLAMNSNAQVKEEVRAMSQGSHSSLILGLPNCTDKFAEKIWKDFIKPYGGDTKRNRKDEELFTDNATIPGISDGNNPVDMYAKIAEIGPDASITIWIDLGGAWLNGDEYSARKQEAEKLLLRYGLEVARQTTANQLEDQQKELKKLENSQKKLERDNEGYHRDIENAKEKIKKAEMEIESNLKDQELAKQKIEAQRKVVEQIQKKLDDIQ